MFYTAFIMQIMCDLYVTVKVNYLENSFTLIHRAAEVIWIHLNQFFFSSGLLLIQKMVNGVEGKHLFAFK